MTYRLKLDDQWLADMALAMDDNIFITDNPAEAMVFDTVLFAEVIAKVVSSMYPEYRTTIIGE